MDNYNGYTELNGAMILSYAPFEATVTQYKQIDNSVSSRLLYVDSGSSSAVDRAIGFN